MNNQNTEQVKNKTFCDMNSARLSIRRKKIFLNNFWLRKTVHSKVIPNIYYPHELGVDKRGQGACSAKRYVGTCNSYSYSFYISVVCSLSSKQTQVRARTSRTDQSYKVPRSVLVCSYGLFGLYMSMNVVHAWQVSQNDWNVVHVSRPLIIAPQEFKQNLHSFVFLAKIFEKILQ